MVARPRRATVGFVLLAATNAVALAAGWANDKQICENAQENRQVLRQLIASGDPANLQPGDAGYDYYSTRPQERQAAHRRNQRILRETVPPITC